MAIVETWFNCELTEPVKVQYLSGNVFSMDSLGNRIGVNVFKDGEPYTLTGSASGYCVLSDGSTVPVVGVVSENRAYIDLIQDCYAVPGAISIILKNTSGDSITTLAAVVSNVYTSRTDQMITPGQSVIDDWSQEITAALQECIDATAGTVKYNAPQSLTDAQKTQARTNIGAASSDLTGAVRYDTSQSLTSTQKAQARTNIAALGSSDLYGFVKYSETQDLTDVQKAKARSNIGALGSSDLDGLVRYNETQTLTDVQKAKARSNIDAASVQDIKETNDILNGSSVLSFVDGYYSTSTGTWHSGASTYKASEPFPVRHGEYVNSADFQQGDYYFFFDSSMQFVSCVMYYQGSPDGVIIPDGVSYCVLQVRLDHYSASTINAILRAAPVFALDQNAVSNDHRYLFRNGYFLVANGTWVSGAGTFKASEFIPVFAGVNVCSSELVRGDYCLFFDDSYNYLGYVGNTSDAAGEFHVIQAGYAVLQVRTENNSNSDIAVTITQPIYGAKPIYAVLSNGELLASSKFDRDNDFVVDFMCHGTNNLPEFANLYVNPNPCRFPKPFTDVSGMTRVLNIGTDWHAPFVVAANNNIDGDRPDVKAYTGGNHGFEIDGTVVSTTASNQFLYYYIDGVQSTEFSGYCSNIEIRWRNTVQAYNTMLINGGGRTVMDEVHKMIFDGREWKTEVTIRPTESVTIYTYYGFQMSGIQSVFPNVRFIGGNDDRGIYDSASAKSSSDIRNKCIVAYGDTYRVTVDLDLTYDVGDHRFCDGSTTIVHITNNKAYHKLFENYTASAGDRFSARATYRFDHV